MNSYAQKWFDTYSLKPNTPFVQKEFWLYFPLEKWQRQGYLKPEEAVVNYEEYLNGIFGLEPSGIHALGGLGWCESAFYPMFEEKMVEDRGEQEVVQDAAGRHVLCFKNRRTGFMPTYLKHPVRDEKSWEENCLWRLDPDTPERIANNELEANEAAARQRDDLMISQRMIGGYMFLRSLAGPEEIMYLFYDNPGLVHKCMRQWLELADAVCARHQKQVEFDEVFLAEDICYNHGPLISPEMIQEFLFPYYQQLISSIRSRQKRHLYVQIDTDGFSDPIIELYQKAINMESLSPFEVASGCDVVRTGRQYPQLIIQGGIDKRILTGDKEMIKRYLDGILPVMYARGGYIPTFDHAVPEEAEFENYLYYRQQCLEYS